MDPPGLYNGLQRTPMDDNGREYSCDQLVVDPMGPKGSFREHEGPRETRYLHLQCLSLKRYAFHLYVTCESTIHKSVVYIDVFHEYDLIGF